jgi:alkanesulfonate monooxygenase SsuD/methylene tetrahydromethanopterin reductase-like flavin-dependent oxidoreductase (luciferase family)
MRYGLLAANVGSYSDPRAVVRLARTAEEAGWEALLLWDHLGFVWGPPAADPWVTLGAVAAATSRLLVGTGSRRCRGGGRRSSRTRSRRSTC